MIHCEPRTYQSFQAEMEMHERWMRCQAEADAEFREEIEEADNRSALCRHAAGVECEMCHEPADSDAEAVEMEAMKGE